MWRMMDDLWDNWSAVDAVFNEAHAWETVTRPGNYADCDMLPLGQIAMTIGDPGYTGEDRGRWTRLTQNEQLTMMTLWGVCHSPLFFGGEMTKNDDVTLNLLTNQALLKIEKETFCAHPLRTTDEESIWLAPRKDGKGCYVALFNLSDQIRKVEVTVRETEMEWHAATELWTGNRKFFGEPLSMDLLPHDAAVYRLE